MFSLDIVLRISTFLLHLGRFFYWYITEKQANVEKPRKRESTLKERLVRYALNIALVVLMIQLLGLDLLSFPHNIFVQVIGFILTAMGVWISILARAELGTNWAHGSEFQIKQDQSLVTTGIYQYIRHPIYLGLLLISFGGELVAESYLAFFFLAMWLYGVYVHGKKEEALLLKHFGKKYEAYMKRTKMIIPHIF